MKKSLSKRVIGIAVLLLLALFLARPQIALLRRKVQDSLSTQLGRPVEMNSVHIRFLPRPGLEIVGLTIHDSSDFGAEPLLRSPDVAAYLRISSLFRGRFEISGLSLSDASFNLSRDLSGKWNIDELLERTSKSSTAPTGSGRKEPRREFPYIEADRARINFKNGFEKTHFALTNAQFSVWQESTDQWGMRLQGSPIRTDANLTDIGIIAVSGAWRRSPVLANTPVQFSFTWKQAQLGQLSKLFWGADKGWRGTALLAGTLAGTLANSSIVADATVDQLRRQEIFIDGDLHVAVHCAADYNSGQSSIRNLDCETPAGDGSLELKGSATGIPFSSYDLAIVAKDASAQFALDLARRVKASIPQDSGAVGSINFALSVNRGGASSSPQLSGIGEALGIRLTSLRTGTELQLGTVPLRLVSSAQSRSKSSVYQVGLDSGELQLGPFTVPLGRPAPAVGQILISRAGYSGFIRGDAGLKRLLQAADVLRVPAPPVSADGNIAVNLALAHKWGDVSPAITGTAQLHSVHADVRGMNSPLQINRADLLIAPDSVKATNIDATASDTIWRGSLLLPRPCAAANTCAFQFHVHAPQVSAASLNQLLNPASAKHPWYGLLGLGASNSFFARASASGSVTIDKLILGSAVCNHFSANLELDKAKLSLANVRGTVLDGKAGGALIADFSVRPPAYSGSGSFENVSLADFASLTRTKWVDGSGSADFEFKTNGWSLTELLDSAELNAAFHIKDGTFPHVVFAEGDDPLRATAFSGEVTLHDRTLSFDKTELKDGDGVFTVSGTATLAGALNLKMTSEGSTGYTVSGTLDQTRVSPILSPPTQAELKP